MVALRQQIRTEPKVEWRTASPLWMKYRRDYSDDYDRPKLLRFNNDAFMDEFVDMVQFQSERMHEWRLRREIWRMPPKTPTLDGSVIVPDDDPYPAELFDEQPIPKLYQPAHERYYLVTASLVCRITGLPDKMLNTTCNESVAFVLRRYMKNPQGDLQEYGFVNGVWEPSPFDEIHPQEATYPLYPVTYEDHLQGRERRLFAGMIPVSQREKMLTAKRVDNMSGYLPDPTAPEDTVDGRIEHLMTVLDADVIQPWRSILQAYELDSEVLAPENTGGDELENNTSTLNEFSRGIDKKRDGLQVTSWYVLLDFAYYLQKYLPDFWALIEPNPDATIPASVDDETETLWQALQDATFRFETRNGQNENKSDTLTISDNKLRGRSGTTDAVSFARALVDIANKATDLEAVRVEYVDPNTVLPAGVIRPDDDDQWPDRRILLCGRDIRDLLREVDSDTVPHLDDHIRAYLEANTPDLTQRVPTLPLAAQISEEGGGDIKTDYGDDTFAIRCVYIRPQRKIGAGRYTLSEVTQKFTMAPFFDPDAPARPIRIPMPIDTTPAGLRKYAKNTMFVLSDTLACQVNAARKITFGDLVLSVLPWPFHKDLPDVSADDCKQGISIGMLCTLSIPIITIVALILLIIMVLLLNTIFFWLPFLIFCLPLPGLKAKD